MRYPTQLLTQVDLLKARLVRNNLPDAFPWGKTPQGEKYWATVFVNLDSLIDQAKEHQLETTTNAHLHPVRLA